MSTLCLCVSLLEQCSCDTHERTEKLILLLAGEVQHHNPKIPRGCSVCQDMSIIHQTDKLVDLPPDRVLPFEQMPMSITLKPVYAG